MSESSRGKRIFVSLSLVASAAASVLGMVLFTISLPGFDDYIPLMIILPLCFSVAVMALLAVYLAYPTERDDEKSTNRRQKC